jgi:small-conductance mechanosensitive channel
MEEQLSSLLLKYEVFLKILFVIVFTIFVAVMVKKLFKKMLLKSAEKADTNLTTLKFLEHSVSVIIYMIGFSLAISMIEFLKPLATSIVAGAGILAIAVGFAAQQTLGNIISGLFIVISKPFQINDRISMSDGLRGIVEDITLRHTVIRNFENQRIIVPNSIISNQVLINSNFSDSRICRFIDVGISYDSDIDLAREIMTEEITNHPLNIDIRSEEDIKEEKPRLIVRVLELSDSSVNMRAWAWANDAPDAFVMQCDVTESIKKRFDKAGITIPFPQRTISYLKPKAST